MKRWLIVFAKEPERGRVKTRLGQALSISQCTDLYKAFLKDTIELAESIPCEERVLAYTSKKRAATFLRKISPTFKFYRQEGKDLGQRMHNAFKFAKKQGASRIVLIGSDSPGLPATFIARAFRQLDKYDIVIGPSVDGGYYLIALNKPCPGIFKGIAWSRDTVLEETLKRARLLKKRVALLDKWYDVDGPESLFRLKLNLRRGKKKGYTHWTRRFLKI